MESLLSLVFSGLKKHGLLNGFFWKGPNMALQSISFLSYFLISLRTFPIIHHLGVAKISKMANRPPKFAENDDTLVMVI